MERQNRNSLRLTLRYAVTLVLPLICSGQVRAAEYILQQGDDEELLAKKLQPGDTVLLANGDWRDTELKFELLQGTQQSPIMIAARSDGKVALTGTSQLRISGNYVTISGLTFRNTNGVSDVVQLRTHSKRHAHNCRITNCVFEQTPASDTGSESRWLSVFGTRNRVDHCYFAGKKSRGPTLVVWVSEQVESHRIDHNHFGPRPELGRNGGETIRIGTSDVSESTCRTVVEDNYFHACDGEAEIISNKSCDNVYRHNLFEQCSGTLTLRHGHRCLVDANVFLGRKKRGTGGVRIIGEDHVVTNNYFEGLRGDAARAALSFMNGIPNGPLHGYAPVRNARVSHNTFLDCKVSVEVGVGAGKKQSAAPLNSEITHNVFMAGKWGICRVHSDAAGITWKANLRQPGSPQRDVTAEQRDLKFRRIENWLLRPSSAEMLETSIVSDVETDIDGFKRKTKSLAGCDDPHTLPRTQPSRKNTGPDWWR